MSTGLEGSIDADSGLKILYCPVEYLDDLVGKFYEYVLQEQIDANSCPKYSIAK